MSQRLDGKVVLITGGGSANADKASIARATTAMVAQIVGKYVVACIVQYLGYPAKR